MPRNRISLVGAVREPGFTSAEGFTITLGSTLPAVTDGDGLSIEGSGNRITLSGNNAVRVLEVNRDAQLALRNLTVANGRADAGGGIYNYGGTLAVTNFTFAGNSGGYGGILNTRGTATLRNTLVANSTSSGNCSGTRIADGGGNLADDDSCDLFGSTNDGLDPEGLKDNGGPTNIIALLPGSAAIDPGANANCQGPTSAASSVRRAAPATSVPSS